MPTDVPKPRHHPARLAVLVSGGGTTVANLAEKIASGDLEAELTVAICSNPASHEKLNARNLGIPVHLIARKDHTDTAAFSQAVFKIIRDADVDLVCLAGFLCLLQIPDDFAYRVLNIHPALLPAFGGKGMYGHHVHEAVLKHGCKVSGCTVHFADQTYDTGPILVQRACAVLPGDTPDTLAARVFAQECLAYPEAIRLLIAGEVTI
ncbi:MAG: phosphoribosylglycinamide formyltransferase [Phycisphaerales bacterium]